MDVVLKSVRQLIRQTMKECGIEHRSSTHMVWSRCFASTPHRSIEYNGPVYVLLRNFPIVSVISYTSTPLDNGIKLDINNPNMLNIFKDFLNEHISDKMKTFDHSKLYAFNERVNFVPDIPLSLSISPRTINLTWWQRVKIVWQAFKIKTRVDQIKENHKNFHWEQAILRHLHNINQDTVDAIRQTVINIETENYCESFVANTTNTIRNQRV